MNIRIQSESLLAFLSLFLLCPCWAKQLWKWQETGSENKKVLVVNMEGNHKSLEIFPHVNPMQNRYKHKSTANKWVNRAEDIDTLLFLLFHFSWCPCLAITFKLHVSRLHVQIILFLNKVHMQYITIYLFIGLYNEFIITSFIHLILV